MTTPLPLRILHLDHTGVPGGGQLGLCRYLEQSPDGQHGVAFLTGGPTVDRVRRTSVPVAVRRADSDFVARHDLITSQRWLRAAIRGFEPDVIVANSAAAAQAYAPLIPSTDAVSLYYMRTDLSAQSMGLVRNKIMTNLYYRHFDGFIANSTWTKDSRPREIHHRPIEVAFPVSGIEGRETGTAVRPTRHTANGRRIFSIVSLSRFDPWKGQQHLLEAADRAQQELLHHDIHIEIDLYGGNVMSDPEYIQQLKETARRVSPTVRFHGHISDVNSKLDQADCLVLSSVLPEPFGQVVVQAMSRGALAIVPDEGGPCDVVRHGENGLVYPSRDTAGLARSILLAARDPHFRLRLAEHGMLRAQDFADTRTAHRLTEAIAALHTEVTARSRRHVHAASDPSGPRSKTPQSGPAAGYDVARTACSSSRPGQAE